jgi:hypothetical protein
MSDCSECGDLTKEVEKLRVMLANALIQIKDMFYDIQKLEDENLLLRDSLVRASEMSREIRSMMEGK